MSYRPISLLVACCKILESYTSEVDLLQAAQGPGIVDCHTVFLEDSKIYLVMELVTGGNLLSRLVQAGNNNTLDQVTVKALAQNLFQGLQALHATGILHNDLNPGNVLLDATTDVPCICDFGSASNILHPAAAHTRRVGSYTAPEVVKGQAPTEASDVYSVGAILYYCLFGRPPPTQQQQQQEALFDNGTVTLSRRCKQLLLLCLHPDASIRPTATEACEHAWLYEQRQPSPPVDSSMSVAPRKFRVGRLFHRRNFSIESQEDATSVYTKTKVSSFE